MVKERKLEEHGKPIEDAYASTSTPDESDSRLRRFTKKFVAIVLLLFVSFTQQGCLPPDWSWCQCDFRDNYWNHIINDWHELYADVDQFTANIRNPESKEYKYFQEMPEGFNCPKEQPTVFWKAWPQLGMTRGLIENTAGDLWMPAARARITGTCMAGHMALLLLCSQGVLFEAEKLEGGPQMRKLELFFGYMVILRDLGQSTEFRQCMGMEGWPFKSLLLRDYAIKWIGPEDKGVNPQAAYYAGGIDIYQMLYYTKAEKLDRASMLPGRRPCVPYKNPECWKRKSLLLLETCEYCCSNFQHKGGRGASWCFTDYWTFEKCCQTDMLDLECEEERTGEDGGCVDCKKQIIFRCFTPPEMQLYKAQVKYNKGLEKDSGLRKTLEEQMKTQSEQHGQLMAREQDYQMKLQTANQKLGIYAAVIRNVTKQAAEAEQENQEGIYNQSFKEHNETYYEATRTHSIMSEALKQWTQGKDTVASAKARIAANVTEKERYNNSLRSTIEDCARRVIAWGERRTERDQAKERFDNAITWEASNRTDSTARNASASEAETSQSGTFVPVNQSRQAAADALEAAEAERLAAQKELSEAEQTYNAQAGVKERAQREVPLKYGTWQGLLSGIERETKELADARTLKETLDANKTATADRIRTLENECVTKCKEVPEPEVRCLLDARRPPKKAKKEATASADGEATTKKVMQKEKKQVEKCEAVKVPSGAAKCEDLNQHCEYWSKNGYCEQRAKYMAKNCPKACNVCETSSEEKEEQKCSMVEEEVEVEVEVDVAGGVAAPVAVSEEEDLEEDESEGAKTEPQYSEEELSTAELRTAKEKVAEIDGRREEIKAKIKELEGGVTSAGEVVSDRVKVRTDAETALREARQFAEKKKSEVTTANETLQETIQTRDEAASNVTLAETWVTGNQTSVELAKQNVTSLKAEQTKAVNMMTAAKENERKTEAFLKDRVAAKKRIELQLDGLKSKLDYYNKEIKELNGTVSAEVKTAISDWFGHEHESTFFSAIGTYLSSAVDVLSTFVGTLGLSTDEATHMKEIVRLMDQERTARKQSNDLETEYESIRDMSQSEKFLESLKAEKVNITVFLRSLLSDIETAQAVVGEREAAEKEVREVVLVAFQAALTAAKANVTSATDALDFAERNLAAALKAVESKAEAEKTAIESVKEAEVSLQGEREKVAKWQKKEQVLVTEELKPAEEKVAAEFRIALGKLGDKKEWERKQKIAEGCGIKSSSTSDADSASSVLGLPDSILNYFSRDEPLLKSLDKQLRGLKRQARTTESLIVNTTASIDTKRTGIDAAREASSTANATLVTETEKANSLSSVRDDKRRIVEEKAKVRAQKDQEHEKALETFREVGKDILTLQKEAEISRVNFFRALDQLGHANRTYLNTEFQLELAVNASTDCNTSRATFAGQLDAAIAAIATAHAEFAKIEEEQAVAVKEQLYDETKAVYADRAKIEEKYRLEMNKQKQALDRRRRRLQQIDTELEMARKLAEKQASKDAMAAAEGAVFAQQKLFDETTKARQTTEEGIHNNTQDVYKAMEAIKEAQIIHDAQDPEDRKRSFAVAW
ncbi:unnamed protein product [Amoebophrya sp. A25]|nr:unnamed protein product [Amoebophrya sp. A25]|eukprot:GSA25T00007375001.1